MVQPLMVHLWVKLSACIKDQKTDMQAVSDYLLMHASACAPSPEVCLEAWCPVTEHENAAPGGGQRAQTTPSARIGTQWEKERLGAELGQRKLSRRTGQKGRLTPSALKLLRSCTTWPPRDLATVLLSLRERKSRARLLCSLR